MSTIFRYAVQTRERRLSEVWSFFHNKNHRCLYATRTSMRQWLKVSFHASRASHIKASEGDPPRSDKQFEWEYPTITHGEPAHVMRIAFPTAGQRGDFGVDERVEYFPEHWRGASCIYLDVFIATTDKLGITNEEYGSLSLRQLDEHTWAYFLVNVSSVTDEVPKGNSEMIVHLGETVRDAAGHPTALTNVTVATYVPPAKIGTLRVFEVANARFDLTTGPDLTPSLIA